MTQDQALAILKSGVNVFLTGAPGTGKTYTINQYLDWAMENGKNVAVTASTGIAATHIDGTTIHSFMGVRNDEPLSTEDLDGICSNRWTQMRLWSAEVIVIDEVSMLSAQLVNNIDAILQAVTGQSESFGGKQMIFVGDFFQLPPIKSDFAFNSQSWKDANLAVCYLDHVYRQTEPVFLDVLTGIRSGVLNDEQMKVVVSRYKEDVHGLDCIRIETKNKNVDEINDKFLARIEGTPKVYNMTSDGLDFVVESLKKSCISPEKLFLKVGARVMFTKNDVINRQYVNGTQGKVTTLGDFEVGVEMKNGDIVTVGFAKWQRVKGYGARKEVIAEISQIPLRLAYAITTHKSQGATFDRAVIDLTQAFESGQSYVAISRVRTLDGLFLQGKINKNFLKTSDIVREYDKSIC